MGLLAEAHRPGLRAPDETSYKASSTLKPINRLEQTPYWRSSPGALDNYYDGEHIWDSSDDIRKMKMVKMYGKLYNYDGLLEQEFENSYSESTGEYIGGIAKFDDGTVNKDGIYKDG